MQKEQNGYIIGVGRLTAMITSVLLIGAILGAFSYYIFAPKLLKHEITTREALLKLEKSFTIHKTAKGWRLEEKGE
jgi:hypothetical protein